MVNTTSAAPLVNTTSVVPLVNTTSAAPLVNTTSAIPLVNTTSAEPLVNTTSADPLVNTTSAEPLVNTTSATPVINTTSAEPLVNTTSAVPVINTTSAEPLVITTSATPLVNTTSAVPLVYTTSSTSVLSNTTSSATSELIKNYTTSDILPTSDLPITSANGSVNPVNVTMVTMNDSTEGSTTMQSSTTPVTLRNNPTLDKSFATRELWVMMELSVPMDTNIQDSGFLRDLETNLAVSYSKARERALEKEGEVDQLLKNLNPEEDIFLRRRRRATSVDGNTAQIIDLSRTAEVPTTSELVFYMVAAGVNVPAVTCAGTFMELSVQELTLLMDTVVLSQVSAYDAVPTTASPQVNTRLIVLLSIFIPLAVISSCMCCCCLCCVLCGPKRKQNERTMAPDTFRMIEYKQKFPYKPYPPIKTTGDQNPIIQPGDEDHDDENDDDENALEAKINLGGETMEADFTPRAFADGDHNFNFESLRSPQTIPATTTSGGGLGATVHEPPMTSHHQSQLLGKSKLGDKNSDIEDTKRHLPALPSTSRSDSDYKRAQREISKILEPDNTNTKPKKKRRKRQGEKSSSQLTDGTESAVGMQTQYRSDDTHEPMSETKQRVHALIEEAFSLVSFRAPPTTNVTLLNGQLEAKEEQPESEELSIVTAARHAADLLTGRKKEFGMQTVMRAEPEQSQVVIVPVSVPSSEGAGTSVVWSPYSVRDELQMISPTREPATLPGRINSSPPSTLSRPPFPDGAEYSASFTHREPLDRSMTQSHEYSTLDMTGTHDYSSSKYHPYAFHKSEEEEEKDKTQEGRSKNYGDFNFLTELENERKQRPADFYDELDLTGTVSGRPPANRSLLDSIKAELNRSNTRRLGDGQ